MRAWKLLLVLSMVGLLSALVFSCDQGDDKDANRGSAYFLGDDDGAADTDDDDDTVQLNDDDTENCHTEFPQSNEYNVTECKELVGPLDTCNCRDDYYRFIDAAADSRIPITPDELWEMIHMYRENDEYLFEGILTALELRQHLLEAANMEFLLEEMDARPLVVTEVSRETFSDYVQKELIFEDPYIGSFPSTLLVSGDKEFNDVIIAIHGHNEESQQDYLDRYKGEDYPINGYGIIAPLVRGMICFDDSDIILDLLCDGFSIVQIEAYEILNIIKYLKYKGVNNIGLIGHSGGSVFGNFSVKILESVKVYVSDFTFDTYLELGADNELLDTVDPEVWRYNQNIRDLSTSHIPILRVPYGYENTNEFGEDTIMYIPGQDEQILRRPDELGSVHDLIFDFFDEYLKE